MKDTTSPLRYFAASNSCRGFCNYYGQCFNEKTVDHLYIIKGGPGTGKSHFMKTVARRARECEYSVTEYYCSSDPASLDGVILRRSGHPTIGLLDGTAPHVSEPVIPGVHEDILNLGVFWQSKQLMEKGADIRRLGQEKAAAYERAYAFLRAVGELDSVVNSRVNNCVRTERLHGLAVRLLRHQPSQERFDSTPALRRAVSMTGKACFHTFENEAAEGTVIIIDDYYGLGYRLMQELYALSEEKKYTVKVSYDPIYPQKIDGLLFPETGLCVLVGDAEEPEGTVTRHISLRRYTEPNALRVVRSDLRHLYGLREQLIEDALKSLSEAAEHHFKIEAIYAAAMDFSAKEVYTEQFCRSLFDE